MATLLIENARVVTLNARGDILERGRVFIDGAAIAAVEPAGAPPRRADRTIDARGGVVMPGLINVHHHLYSTFARGFAPPGEPAGNFQQILERLWWKLDRALEPEDVYLSALHPILDGVRAGCTTIVDHHASPSCRDGSLDLIERAVREVGINACLCYEVSDRNVEGAGLEENERFLRKCRAGGDDQVTALFGLHASMTLGDRTLERVGDAVRRLGCGVHVHVDEAECDGEVSRARFGAAPMERFARHGLVTPGSLFAHGIHLDARGLELLQQSGAMAVTNPESNMNNGLAMTPVLEMLGRGILLGLGTDGMSSAMIPAARALYLAHRAARRDPRIAFAEACRMLLENNRAIAARLFRAPRGVLEPGAQADLLVADYEPYTPFDGTTFYGHLLFGLVGARLTHTICRGRVLLDDGRIPHVDEAAIRARSVERARRLWARIR